MKNENENKKENIVKKTTSECSCGKRAAKKCMNRSCFRCCSHSSTSSCKFHMNYRRAKEICAIQKVPINAFDNPQDIYVTFNGNSDLLSNQNMRAITRCFKNIVRINDISGIDINIK